MIALPESFVPPPGLEPPTTPPPGLQRPSKTWSEIVKGQEPKVFRKSSDSDEETRASFVCSESEGSDGEHSGSLGNGVCTSPSLASEGAGVTPVKFSLEVEERTPLRKCAPVFTPLKTTAPAFTPGGYSQPTVPAPPGLEMEQPSYSQPTVPPPPGLRTKLSIGAKVFVPMGQAA